MYGVLGESKTAFNGIANFPDPLTDLPAPYLDTLHSDYAFIISASGPVHSFIPFAADSATVHTRWDFGLYPNPARGELYVQFSDDRPKEIAVYDLSGKRVYAQAEVTDHIHRIPTTGFAQGPYCIRVSDAASSRMKTFIIR